ISGGERRTNCRLARCPGSGTPSRSRTKIRTYRRAAIYHKERLMTSAITDVKRKTADGYKTTTASPLSTDELRKMDAYWRALNYFFVGQIYFTVIPLFTYTVKQERTQHRSL